MGLWKPDPSFYPSPQDAMKAPQEELAYVVAFNPDQDDRPDALAVVDTEEGEIIGWTPMPYVGDELHHFGWAACSSALCPYAPHPHIERRHLIIPGIRSSRLYIVDVKANPLKPTITKVIEADEIAEKTGYSRPHTVHCGPDGIYISALGDVEGKGPGGIFVLDHTTFDIVGKWEKERGPQYLHYDFWWHLGHDILISSEWGTPEMVEAGLNPEYLLGGRYGQRLHIWDLRHRRHLQALETSEDEQMVLELRPAHDPRQTYGFAGVVINNKDLSGSIWLWSQEDGKWSMKKVIEIPAEPAEPEKLPPMLKGFSMVPPLITDINLSLDDRFLYVSCWGTGEVRQYDVSNPSEPKLTGSVRLGGIANLTPHPKVGFVNGGPQMIEVSRDGRRVYFTNSLYDSWDNQFYPDGIQGWMVKLDADPNGGLTLDPEFFVDFSQHNYRAHQIRLAGGDASSDSYWYS
ncbi:selenium-binding protein 1 [Marininema mesophilum]|uniref:Methanethiol oxidase n=1 Tax=Marininema mesophilum TaxID=1048340 RepID=A0A1H2ZGE3_9BACL|nr:selenium-binding protein SBP56-related protein [Marininema mesophilum]SDX16461.1 selenium-binding protein 1 [Marininema mesophilum]